MKNLILLIFLLLTNYTLFGQSEKTLIKTFPSNTTEIMFDFECEKSISNWGNDYVKIEFTVVSSTSQATLESLLKTNRYTLESSLDNEIQIISLPNLKPLKIGNTQLTEKFKIKVWIPDQSKLKEKVSL
jgi:hypothetical protein